MEASPFSDEKAYRIAYLIAGYINKKLSEAEHDELDEWVEASDENMVLFEELTDEKNIEANLAWLEGIQTKKALERTKERIQFKTPKKKRRTWMLAAAASIVVAVAAIYIVGSKRANAPELNRISADAAPGGNKAVLTLSDGRTINLQGKDNGIIQNGTGTKIEKTGEGEIMYQKLTANKKAAFNTIDIPKGGKYTLTLSDGTQIWLNALSSLRFPEQFGDTERVVELRGEAFFYVAKDRQHPFIVRIGNEEVKVLGTQFNVLAYGDEDVKRITLLEGSVQVAHSLGSARNKLAQGDNSVIIKPGEAVSIHHGSLSVDKNADTEAATGWKNGQFVFRDADVYSIMRQAERWYDVNVIYRTTSSEHFNFSVSRNETLSKLLHLMELTGKIHFKIENKTVYALP